jgi:nucleoside-diphosphate-sugar epimerase
VRMLRQHGVEVPLGVRLPFGVVRTMVGALGRVNARAFDGGARLPSMLNPASLDARFKPLIYPNARAKAVLGWTPRYGVEEAARRAVS